MTVLTQIPTTLDDSVLEWQQDLLVAGNSMTGPLASGLPSWLVGTGTAQSSAQLANSQLNAQSLNQSGLMNSQVVTGAQNLQNLQNAGIYTGAGSPTTLTTASGSLYVSGPNTFINTGGGHWQSLPVTAVGQHVFFPTAPQQRMQFHYVLDSIEDSGRTKAPYSDRAVKVRDRRQFDDETGEVDLVGFVDILLANGHLPSSVEYYIGDAESRLGIKFVDQD